MNYNHNKIFDDITKKYLRDIITYYIGKLLPGLIGFISIPILLRLFGVEVYGEYSLVISTILLLNSGVFGWIYQSVMRFYTEKDGGSDVPEIISISFKLNTLLYITVAAIGIILLVIFNYGLTFILIASLVLYILNLFSLSTIIQRAKLNSAKVIIADALRSSIYLILALTGYFFRDILSDHHIVIFLVFSNGIGYFVGYLYLRSYRIFWKESINQLFKIHLQSIQIRKMLSFGLPLAGWFLFSYLLNISDRYIIIYFYDYETVGEYAAIYDNFSKIMTLVFTPILFAMQPLIIKLYNEGNESRAFGVIKKTIIYELITFTILLILIILIKRYYIVKILDLNIERTSGLVIPILIGSFFWSFAMIAHKPLELTKKTKSMLWGISIALLIKLLVNVLLIPVWGIIVAAYTTILGAGIYLLFILLRIIRDR